MLEKTHCEAPEDYFITSGDMVGKSGVWAHFGSWDFDRALIYNTLKKKEYANDKDKSVKFLKDRFNYSDKDAENLYYEVQSITTSEAANGWIAPWPGYAGSAGCSRNEDTLTCNNGFIIDLKNMEVSAKNQNGEILHPKKISFPKDDDVIIKEYNTSVVKLQNGRFLGFALVKSGDSYELLQMDADLTDSMFTRLFYQEGIGLKHFKKFSDERTLFGSRVIVWKIDWEGKERNVIKEQQKAETISGNEGLNKKEENLSEQTNESLNNSQNS